MAYAANTSNDSTGKLEATARNVTANVADTAADLAGKAGQHIESAIGSAEATVRSLAEQGKDAGERVHEVAGNFKGAVEKSIDTQPMATLAMAAAAGFVLGALWKS